jgi:replicative DNA helicase
MDIEDNILESYTLCDLAAERAVLIGIYKYGEDAYIDIDTIVDSDSFWDTTNQILFKCFKNLYEERSIKSFDQSSLFACLSELGYGNLLDSKTDVQYIRSIFNGNIKLESVRTWAAKIRKLQIARLLRARLEQAKEEVERLNGTESIDKILGIAEEAIFDFSSSLQSENSSENTLIGDGLEAFLDYVEENPSDIIGISSGLPTYDMAIGGGFRRKTVSLISARPKTGKSMLCINIGLHVSKTLDIPILYLDTEMTKEDHWARMLPNLCFEDGVKISINEIESGNYASSDFKKNKVRGIAKNILNKIPFYHENVSGKPFEEILSIIRRWITREVGFDENGNRKDCLIIYDYFKLMTGDNINNNMKEYMLLGFMMTSLHNFAVKYDIPILSFVQSNREGIDKESSDIVSGSDRISWLVTNCSVFKDKTPEEIAEHGPENGNRKLIPIYTRHGEGLRQGDYINVHFHGKYGKIVEGKTKYAVLSENSQQQTETETE